MKVICLIQYIRDYCGGNYKLFLERARRMRIERSQDSPAMSVSISTIDDTSALSDVNGQKGSLNESQ